MKTLNLLAVLSAMALPLLAAEEKPVNFIPAKPDPLVGDWQGANPHYVAQIYYKQRKFDEVLKYASAIHDTTNSRNGLEIGRMIGELALARSAPPARPDPRPEARP